MRGAGERAGREQSEGRSRGCAADVALPSRRENRSEMPAKDMLSLESGKKKSVPARKFDSQDKVHKKMTKQSSVDDELGQVEKKLGKNQGKGKKKKQEGGGGCRGRGRRCLLVHWCACICV